MREYKKRAAEAARNPAQAAETRAEYGGNAAVRPRGTYPLERRAVRRPEEKLGLFRRETTEGVRKADLRRKARRGAAADEAEALCREIRGRGGLAG